MLADPHTAYGRAQLALGFFALLSWQIMGIMGIEQDLAAQLRRRDLEGIFRFRHREFVGDDDVPHPLHLLVA